MRKPEQRLYRVGTMPLIFIFVLSVSRMAGMPQHAVPTQ